MNSAINFIKSEFSGWNDKERIFAPLLLLTLIFISLYMNDSTIATVQACFSFLYTIFAGKGKISCYVFGILGTLCYSYLSFKNAIYGNLLLHLGYFFPVQVIGIFAWKNKLKNNVIVKTQLNNKERVVLTVIILFSALIISYCLNFFHDKFPVMDAFSTVLSVSAMYLTIKRCIEQWVLWTIVNILSIIMWSIVFLNGSNTFATMFVWVIHLFLGIYFFIRWKKEMRLPN